jgi:hypothetical protein
MKIACNILNLYLKGIMQMSTPVETITINSLDKKLNSKAGFSNYKKQAYCRVMTNALLMEGMTEQNQVRFCHAYVATGIKPLIKLMNSEKGKDWKHIIVSLIKQPYFVSVVRMRLRFFMQLLSGSMHNAFNKNSTAILGYSIENILSMEFDSKNKFRMDNIEYFKMYILNPWKAENTTITSVDANSIDRLTKYVEDCIKADEHEIIKKHPNFPPFISWVKGLEKNNKNPVHFEDDKTANDLNKGVITQHLEKREESVQHVISDKTIEDSKQDKEIQGSNHAQHERVALSLQDVIDAFEKKIVERDIEIKNLRMQVTDLNEQIRREKQAARDIQSKLTNELANEKQSHEAAVKKLTTEINTYVETLNQQDQYISEQKNQLQERKELLKDNDVRFDNYYKQHMLALGNKLKLSFSDLRDSINDLQGDEKEFIETAFLDIVECLKKEGINV